MKHANENGLKNNLGNAKLTAEEVLEIRAKYIPRVYTAPMLAIEYGVTEGHIMKIISRRIWVDHNLNKSSTKYATG